MMNNLPQSAAEGTVSSDGVPKPLIQIINGDCMEAMKEMPDKAYDLAIVDPPYGIEINTYREQSKHNGLGVKRQWNLDWNIKPGAAYFHELARISINQIVWGGNYFNLPSSEGWIVWDKENGDIKFADCELAWTSYNRAIRQFTFRWNGMLQGDMKNKEPRIHPTQKPVKLYEWLLKNYAKPGDKILDTHLGSGSIAIACYNLDFDLTGYETDTEYYEAACERLEKHKQQPRLFDGPLQDERTAQPGLVL
jgi:site-specific DNA-methyltransferase (adenine-specific)